jgi:hypothetical protein
MWRLQPEEPARASRPQEADMPDCICAMINNDLNMPCCHDQFPGGYVGVNVPHFYSRADPPSTAPSRSPKLDMTPLHNFSASRKNRTRGRLGRKEGARSARGTPQDGIVTFKKIENESAYLALLQWMSTITSSPQVEPKSLRPAIWFPPPPQKHISFLWDLQIPFALAV